MDVACFKVGEVCSAPRRIPSLAGVRSHMGLACGGREGERRGSVCNVGLKAHEGKACISCSVILQSVIRSGERPLLRA